MSARLRGPTAALALAVIAFSMLLGADLSRPLLWNDEAFTAVYAERMLAHGVPRVDDGRNVIYALDAPLEVGVDERLGAYIGSPWGQYAFGTIGVLLSRSAEDPYARTALMRLPFALAGTAGLALLLLALWPLLGDGRRRLVAATAFVLLLCVSVSLLLHLREARYYALVVALGGLVVWLHRRREVTRDLGPLPHGVALVAALTALFLCYYPAALAFGLALALDAGARALRGEAGTAARWLPLVFAAALATPLAVYFELPRMVRVLSQDFDNSIGAYVTGLSTLLRHLLRFEWLAPVLVAKALLLLRDRTAGDETERRRRELSRFLTTLAVVYAAVVGRTPYFFERYFVVLGPLLAALAVLDTCRVIDAIRGPARAPARGLLVAVFAACLVVRVPEVTGRLLELRDPVEGPLDVVIPYLRERYEDPSSLVVATNYEEAAFVWYLDCRTIVGFNGAALRRDLALSPDVVVPRPWQRHRDVLNELLRAGAYQRRAFDVENTRTNQIPSLSPHTAGGLLHRFRTRRPERPGRRVLVFERRVE